MPSDFPAANVLGDPTVLETPYQTAIEDMLARVRQMPGADYNVSGSTNISAGALTPPDNWLVTVDTESGNADDLEQIAWTNYTSGTTATESGRLLFLAVEGGKVITLKSAAVAGKEKILIPDVQDVILRSGDVAALYQTPSGWVVTYVSRLQAPDYVVYGTGTQSLPDSSGTLFDFSGGGVMANGLSSVITTSGGTDIVIPSSVRYFRVYGHVEILTTNDPGSAFAQLLFNGASDVRGGKASMRLLQAVLLPSILKVDTGPLFIGGFTPPLTIQLQVFQTNDSAATLDIVSSRSLLGVELLR